MQSLGLRFGRDEVVAVRVREDGSWESRRLALDELESLTDWVEAAGSRIGAVAAVELHTRLLRFPFSQARKIQQAVPVFLDGQIPGDLDEWLRWTQVDRDHRGGLAEVLLTPQAAVDAIRERLPEDWSLRFLEPEALLMAARRAPDEALLWCEPDRTTRIARTGTRWTATSIPIGGRNPADHPARMATLRARLLALGGRDDPHSQAPAEVWQLAGDPDAIAGVQAALSETEGPFELRIESVDETTTDLALVAARTAAFAALERARPRWNLAPRRTLLASGLWRSGPVRALGPAVAASLLFGTCAVQSGTRAVEAEAAGLRGEVTQIYRRTFPQGRMIDPARQMRAVVERAGPADAGAGGPGAAFLDRLAVVGSAVTEPALIISEIRTAGRDWTLRGDAPDFASVDALKNGIAALDWAANVRVQRAEQTVDRSAIRFQISFADGGTP